MEILIVLISVLVMHGTATKLRNERKITLSGAVSGNANFDGSKNINIVTTQSNIKVLEGKVTIQAKELQNSTIVTYPEGWNFDNTIILSASSGFLVGGSLVSFTYGGGPKNDWYPNIVNFIDVTTGSSGIQITLNYDRSKEETPLDVFYKVVLMKIS